MLAFTVIGFAAVAFAFARPAAADSPLFADWTIPGSPYSVAVESPTVIWATLPAENAVVRLEISPLGVATSELFALPAPNSEPYDIAFAAGAAWFTERAGNRIGRIDATTRTLEEFDIPTPGSQPVGLAVGPGAPVRVWFAERHANAIGVLAYTNPQDFTIAEYPVPWPNSQPERVAADTANVWFTAPGSSRLGLFRPALWPSTSAFYGIGTGVVSQPWGTTVDAYGWPWFTERQTGRVGVYQPGTLSDIRWFRPPTPGSDPYDVDSLQDQIVFAERLGDRVALLNRQTGKMREFSLPGAQPTSVAFDPGGCVWVAESAARKIGRWCPPYFYPLYLPVIWK